MLRIKSINSRSICPLKLSLKERKLQIVNRSSIPFEGSIPFPPNTPYEAMMDHTPNHRTSVSVEIIGPAS